MTASPTPAPDRDMEIRHLAYSGAMRRCTLQFSIFFGLLAALVTYVHQGGVDDAIPAAATAFGLVCVPAYLVGLVIYWFVSLGQKSHIIFDPARDRFGYPVCFLGLMFWEEEKISDIERVVGDDEESSLFDANFICLHGRFGRIKLPFYSHDQREIARAALRAARSQMSIQEMRDQQAESKAALQQEIKKSVSNMETSTRGVHTPSAKSSSHPR